MQIQKLQVTNVNCICNHLGTDGLNEFWIIRVSESKNADGISQTRHQFPIWYTDSSSKRLEKTR